MAEDPYIKALLQYMKTPVLERFRLIEEALEDPELKKYYKMLWTSEAKHGNIYIKMALNYFDESVVYKRLDWWVAKEAEIVEALPVRAALH